MGGPAHGIALLEAAIERIRQGQKQYGPPDVMFERVAKIWSALLGITVTAEDVARCLIGFKLVRWDITDDDDVVEDSCKDIGGYSGAGFEARLVARSKRDA
jgi:hypothetical protein